MPRLDRTFREDDAFRFWGRNLDQGEVGEGVVLFVLGVPLLALQASRITGLSLRRTIGNLLVLRYQGATLRTVLDLVLNAASDLDDVLEGPFALNPFFGTETRRVFGQVLSRNPFFPGGLR